MRIELDTGTEAEIAIPYGSTRGLVVIPDIMGLRPLFDDLVKRLSEDYGWAVCAPQLYVGQEHLTLDERQAAAKDLDDGLVLADLLGAADATGTETVGCIGFCMGGMYATKAVVTGRFNRIAPFYGMIRLPETWRGPGQGEPLDALANGEPTSVLAIVGTEDPYTPPADIADLEATGATVVRYDGAGHGFVHDPSREGHRPADAADAWQRVADWINEVD